MKENGNIKDSDNSDSRSINNNDKGNIVIMITIAI